MNANMDWSQILKERTHIENFRKQRSEEDICTSMIGRSRRIETITHRSPSWFFDFCPNVLLKG